MTRVPILICNRIPIGPSGPWDGAIEAPAEPSPVVQREVLHDEVDISTGDGGQLFETGLTVVPGLVPCGIILIESGVIQCGIGLMESGLIQCGIGLIKSGPIPRGIGLIESGPIQCGIGLIESIQIPCGIRGNKKIILLCPYD